MTGPGSDTATEPSAGVATDAPVDPTEPRGTTPGEPPARSGLALRDLVDEALSSAFARPGRAVLTALGTVLGIVTLVATAGLSRTAGQQIVDRFDELAASTVDVQPATVPGGPDGSKRVVVGNPMGWDAPRRVDRLAGVDAAATLSDVVLAQGQTVTAARFNRILHLAETSPNKDIINEVVLRTQSQAVYSPDNIGHFGLNLARYSHFTSPIRRYADVTIHRALIRALKLGDDGAVDKEEERYAETAEHISTAERTSMAAERDATARYISAFLADRVGNTFEGRVTGVTRFGLFIRLDETQADGLAPISTLGNERWVHDEAAHALVGEQTGQRFPLGMRVEVRLDEATPISGGLLFSVLSDPLEAIPGWRKSRASRQSHSGGGFRDRDTKRGKRRR